jgi:hypothetical protein
VENLGDGKFKLHELPLEAQLAPIYGIQAVDINNDQYVDLVLVGNDFGMETQQGRADALSGLVLQNNGKGDFEALTLEESQFFVPGDAKSLVQVRTTNGVLFLASQNQGSLKVYEPRSANFVDLISINPGEIQALISFEDGSQRRVEFQLGEGFQSQSSRFLQKTPNLKSVTFYDYTGKTTRTIQ